jgi:hypothetical protein
METGWSSENLSYYEYGKQPNQAEMSTLYFKIFGCSDIVAFLGKGWKKGKKARSKTRPRSKPRPNLTTPKQVRLA